MVKKVLQLFILFAIIGIILVKTPVIPYTIQLIYSSPCDTPIHYKVEFVDPRFQITQQTFLTDIQQAGTIWDQAIGKDLFMYDQQNESSLSINMVFDQRQSLTNQIGSLENQLSTEKNSIDPQIAQYENESADFKKRLASLNDQISYWNSKGGAPSDEYNKLKSEQQSLQQEANKLNALAKSLNQSANNYNAQVGQLNQTVDTYNSALQLRPEEGIYDGKNNRINIYFNISHNELLHTLAHEMGHSLGLDHNINPQSIMFPKTTTSLTPSIDDLAALQKICQKKTIFDRISEEISILRHQSATQRN